MSRSTTPDFKDSRGVKLRKERNNLLGKMVAEYILSQDQLTQTVANDNPTTPERETDSITA